MNKNAIRTQIKALELLNKENPFRYPKGSSICFNDAPKNIDGRYLVNCAWCNKKDLANGGDNKVIAPPEWQNIPVEQAEEICMMFDNSMLLSFYRISSRSFSNDNLSEFLYSQSPESYIKIVLLTTKQN